MKLTERIESIAATGAIIESMPADLQEVLQKTEAGNRWFTEMHCRLMLKNFTNAFLNAEKLQQWAFPYGELPDGGKTIGLVLAGNVPYVGMHDLLCVLMSGHRAMVKLSSKDLYFFPWWHNTLTEINPAFAYRIVFAERLENFDAVIATGSNNSSRYFEYYFGKYPHIIRKNRTSVAIITGNESDEQLKLLGRDVFYFYGLGCRNVSKLFVPRDFNVERIFPLWEDFNYVQDNNKYKNNYDYNRALLLLNNTPHLANDFFMLVETPDLFSPLSTVYYERYDNAEALQEKINAIGDQLQCVVANATGNTPFGQTQFPALADYADHVDTMQFLKGI